MTLLKIGLIVLSCLFMMFHGPIAFAKVPHYSSIIQTDYQNYATINDEGFAYTIYPDPDISSEIHPIDEKSSERVLLLTFDDAPRIPESEVMTLMDTLRKKDVGALFLVNGKFLYDEEGKNLLKKIYEFGFEIGNHTTNHPNLRELSYQEQYEEIASTNQLIEEITGYKPRWFRPPFGKFNMDTILICNQLGLQLMTWSFGYDWMEEYQTGDRLAEISLNNEYIRSGANILMHDLPWTAQALEKMIDGYRAMGYHLVDPYIIKHQANSVTPLAEH